MVTFVVRDLVHSDVKIMYWLGIIIIYVCSLVYMVMFLPSELFQISYWVFFSPSILLPINCL